jgi:hypothetical protein
MASQVRTKSDARFLLIVLQLMVMPPLVKVIMLVKSHWQQVLSYQALSNHPSLPFNVQASQHMMMIAVCPINRVAFGTAAKNFQAYRPYILGIPLILRKML